MSTPFPRPSRRRARRIAVVLTGCVAAAALTIPVLTPSGDDTAHAAMPMVAVPAAANEPTSQVLPRDGWTEEASDYQGSGVAEKAIDGDTTTGWHSKFKPTAFPHSLTIDLKTPTAISGLRYLPPKAGSRNGTIGDYDISVSTDKNTWTTVTTGTWADDNTEKTATFATTTARYVRLTATSEAGNRGPLTQIVEINLLGTPPTTTAPPTNPTPTNPAPPNTAGLKGRWSSVIGFPLVPTSMAVLPNGKVLLWSAYATTGFGSGNPAKTQVAIYDPATNTSSKREIVNTKHEMFCTGISMLPDGRILITGGSSAGATTIYNPDNDTWKSGPKLNIPRGYQSDVTLSNGSVLTLGGSWSGGEGGKDAELFLPRGTWKRLPGITADKILTNDAGGVYRADNHAWLFSVGQGNVFHAGPSTQMNWISTSGNGSMASAGSRAGDRHALNGNAVMYAPGKILTNGGAQNYVNSDATKNAFVIDITAGYGKTPKVTRTGSMAAARAFQNSVVLPDGKVLVVGGQSHAEPFTDTTAAMSPELWDPATGKFTPMAAHAVPRTYHSIAQLLPDGRVFSAGGGLCGKCATNHPDGQIFTPPYLLNADGTARTRPTITTAPTDGQATKTITVKTGAAVASFALVRMGATTHAVNTDQRRIPLAAGTGTTHTLKIPERAKVTPGDYMLFALDANGTPSIAKIINIR